MSTLADDLLTCIGRPLDDLLALPSLQAATDSPPEGEEVAGQHYVSFNDLGVEMELDGGRVMTIFLFVEVVPPQQSAEESESGYRPFRHPLPFGLEHGGTRADARDLLGTPARIGGGDGSAIAGLGPVRPWDQYRFEDYAATLTWNDAETTLEQITIMHPDRVPG